MKRSTKEGVTVMKHFSRPLLAFFVFIVCANMGEQTKNRSVVGTDTPDVNVYGKLEDTSGNEFTIHNLRIGRMYRDVPMYTTPPQETDNPADSTTYKDLVELKTISVPHPTKIESYNGRDYIGVDTITRSGEPEHYIIERSRSVICDVPRGKDLEKKEFKFNRIKTITINGFTRNNSEEEAHKKEPTPIKKETKKKDDATSTVAPTIKQEDDTTPTHENKNAPEKALSPKNEGTPVIPEG